MDTLIIASDTLAIKFKTVTDVSRSCVESVGTNSNDVLIVFAICSCVGVIAICGICKFYSMKKSEAERQIVIRKLEFEQEVERIRIKQAADLKQELLKSTKEKSYDAYIAKIEQLIDSL